MQMSQPILGQQPVTTSPPPDDSPVPVSPSVPNADFELDHSWALTQTGMLLQQLTIALKHDAIEPSTLASDWRTQFAPIDPDYSVTLSGRSPIWLHLAIHCQLPEVPLYASYDPRYGGSIITRCADPEFMPGQILSVQPSHHPDPTALAPAIAIVGPPDSGKSVFSHALRRALLDRGRRVLLQRANWDGEGNFIHELPDGCDPEIFKAEHKRGMSDRFFGHHADDIQALRHNQDVVLVDFGGMIQPEKQPLLDVCTHYIIVSSNPEKTADWHNFCQRAGLQPIAELSTVLDTIETRHSDDPYLRYTSGYWKIGQAPPIPQTLLQRLLVLEHTQIPSSIGNTDRASMSTTTSANHPSQIELQLIPHTTRDGLAYQHLRICLTSQDGLVEPSDIIGLRLPSELNPTQGVVLEGRAPIWVYAYLVHECHATAWVGCFDPRQQGAIVVETHTRQTQVGAVLLIDLPTTS
jgi:CRISPR-associated protein Csx3